MWKSNVQNSKGFTNLQAPLYIINVASISVVHSRIEDLKILLFLDFYQKWGLKEVIQSLSLSKDIQFK